MTGQLTKVRHTDKKDNTQNVTEKPERNYLLESSTWQ